MSYKKKKRWYVIKTVSRFEGRVAQYLDEYIKINDMEKLFGDVIIPSEKIIEISGWSRKRVPKLFKGYVLVQMIMNYASWHLVRSIPRIMGFIGGTYDRPTPISDKEVYAIMHSLQHFCEKKKNKSFFEPGELVKVKDGPYSDFNGIVEKVDYEKSILKLSLSILGRATYIELGFSQVNKK